MKRKLLLVTFMMLVGSMGIVKADILDGWTKMETSVVANPQNYYFIILHTDNSLMLGVTKSCSTDADGVAQNTTSSNYDFISYQTASEPAQDLCKVWAIESCTAEGYTSAYVVRSLANVDCPVNTGSSQWELKTDGTVHENSSESAAFNIVLSDGYWKLQDATSTTYYWGAWSNAAYVNTERIAGNAGGNGTTTAGSYNIYYMSRTNFNQKYQFFGGTDMNHTIVNRGFEYGNATGWTTTYNETFVKNATDIKGSNDTNVVPQAGSYYVYFWGGGVQQSLKQTVDHLPNGKYSSTIYLCNDVNYEFNGASAGSWGASTPKDEWTLVTVGNQDVSDGDAVLDIQNWWDGAADNANITYVPNTVSDDASAYTLGAATTPLTWYSMVIANAGTYMGHLHNRVD